MQPKDAVKSVDCWNQYRCPKGLEGREVAAKMNKGHFDLTTWGIKHVRIEPDFVVLDVGCGGGKTLSRLTRRAFLGKVYGIDYSAYLTVSILNVFAHFNLLRNMTFGLAPSIFP